MDVKGWGSKWNVYFVKLIFFFFVRKKVIFNSVSDNEGKGIFFFRYVVSIVFLIWKINFFIDVN